MFEGDNEITFSKETGRRFLSLSMSTFFNSPIEVTNVESDYKGLTIRFTEAVDKEKEDAKDADVSSNLNG